MYFFSFLVIFFDIFLKIFLNNKFIFLYLPILYFFYLNQDRSFFLFFFILSILNDIYLFLPFGFTGLILSILFLVSMLIFRFFEKDNLIIILMYLSFMVLVLISLYFSILSISFLNFIFLRVIFINLIFSYLIFIVLFKISKNNFILK